MQSFKKISEETRDRTNLKCKDDLIPRFETPTVVEGEKREHGDYFGCRYVQMIGSLSRKESVSFINGHPAFEVKLYHRQQVTRLTQVPYFRFLSFHSTLYLKWSTCQAFMSRVVTWKEYVSSL